MQTTTVHNAQKAQRRQIHLDPDFSTLKMLLQICQAQGLDLNRLEYVRQLALAGKIEG